MTSNKEVSSTEKLLDVIRNKKTSSKFVKAPGSPPSGEKSRLPFPELLQPRKTVSIGIDIAPHMLKLIKVARSSDNMWKLLDHSVLPLEADISRDAPEFAIFLKSELHKFCGPAGKFKLWANMSSARVEVASIRIPKVAKKQIESAVKWTAKKAMSFKEKDVILDFEIGDEVIENGVAKLVAMVYTAPRQEVKEIQRLFEDIGYPLDGLAIAPFGIQNLFKTNWMPALDQTVATLDIEMDRARINIFSKGNLVMTRSIRTGSDSMAQELMEGYNERVNRVSFEESRIEAPVPGDFAGDSFMKIEDARNVLLGLSPDSHSSEDVRKHFNFDEKDIIEWIDPALDRLVRQIDRTFRHSTVTLGNEKVSAIYISTSITVRKPLVDYIGNDLGIVKGVLDPLEPGGPLVGEITSALSVSDRVSLVPALGAALSDLSHTPNLLFTYKNKETRSNIEKGNRLIFVAAAVVLLICVVVLFAMSGVVNEKKAVITKLEQQLKQNIVVDETIIPIFVSKVKDDLNHVREYSERYLGVAAIKELSLITPSNIHLLHVTAHMGTTPAGEEKGGKRVGSVTMEGIVSGSMNSLEDSLVAYVLKLQSSPVFSQAKITKSNSESFKNVEVLRFILNVKFGEGIT